MYRNIYLSNRSDYLSLMDNRHPFMIGGDIEKEVQDGVYDKVIGSGGFGRIFGSSATPNVIKLMYSAHCTDAKKEFTIHKACYDALKASPVKMSQVQVVDPIEFTTKTVRMSDVDYDCGYKMPFIQNINSLDGRFDKVLYHLIFKTDEPYQKMFDKQVGRNYSKAVSDENPSRGFFATQKYIKNNILDVLGAEPKGDIKSLNDISARFGHLFAVCVFGAGFVPIDAEYTLSAADGKLCVTLLDFGMFVPIDFAPVFDEILGAEKMEQKRVKHFDDIADKITSDICAMDLYFPYNTDSSFESFSSAFTDAATAIVKAEEDETKQKNMTDLLSGIVSKFEDM